MTRSNINNEKQEKKLTSVGYPRNSFKICIPGRIITLGQLRSDLQEMETRNIQSCYPAVVAWCDYSSHFSFSKFVIWSHGGSNPAWSEILRGYSQNRNKMLCRVGAFKVCVMAVWFIHDVRDIEERL